MAIERFGHPESNIHIVKAPAISATPSWTCASGVVVSEPNALSTGTRNVCTCVSCSRTGIKETREGNVGGWSVSSHVFLRC